MTTTAFLIQLLSAIHYEDRVMVLQTLERLIWDIEHDRPLPGVTPGLRTYDQQRRDVKTHTFTIEEER